VCLPADAIPVEFYRPMLAEFSLPAPLTQSSFAYLFRSGGDGGSYAVSCRILAPEVLGCGGVAKSRRLQISCSVSAGSSHATEIVRRLLATFAYGLGTEPARTGTLAVLCGIALGCTAAYE
jgi:hypothetical protein